MRARPMTRRPPTPRAVLVLRDRLRSCSRAGIGLRDPWPADEPRFVLVAKQMWDSGDWLFPHRGHELYPDKPPLFFWLLGAAYAAGARLDVGVPAAVAARGDGRRCGWPTTSPPAVVASRRACGRRSRCSRARSSSTRPSARRSIRPWCASSRSACTASRATCCSARTGAGTGSAASPPGLGVISKGVGFPRAAGAAAVRADALAALDRARGTWARAMRWRWSGGALAFLGAIALWFVPMLVTALDQRRSGTSRLPRRTAVQADRDALHQRLAPPRNRPWYFLEVIAGVLAAVLAGVAVAVAALARCVARSAMRGCGCRWAGRCWCCVFFSASPGKRDMYILPMLPMVAVAAGPYLEAITASKRFRALLARAGRRARHRVRRRGGIGGVAGRAAFRI